MANSNSSGGVRSEPGFNTPAKTTAPEVNEYTSLNPRLEPDPDQEIDDEPEISDLPQVVTESYGTGVKDAPGRTHTTRTTDDEINPQSTNPHLSGGDVDAAWQGVQHMNGEEMVGGTVATPDQDIVDELGVAMGTEMDDREDFYGNDKFTLRDSRRWDLDPASAEDYQDRREES